MAPATAAFDLNTSGENYKDLAITATSGTGGTVSKLYLGGTEVPKSSGTNWSLSNGVITVEKEYLSTLTAGEKVFTVTFTKDNSCTLTITIEDTTAG